MSLSKNGASLRERKGAPSPNAKQNHPAPINIYTAPKPQHQVGQGVSLPCAFFSTCPLPHRGFSVALLWHFSLFYFIFYPQSGIIIFVRFYLCRTMGKKKRRLSSGPSISRPLDMALGIRSQVLLEMER